MKFQSITQNDGGNAMRSAQSGFKFSVTRLSDSKVAFCTRRPRRDSKYWGFKYMVWDIESNSKAL